MFNTCNRKNRIKICAVTGLLIGSVLVAAACGGSGGSGSSDHSGESSSAAQTAPRATVTDLLLPSAPGTDVYTSGDITLDYSNISEGYYMLQYSGSADSVRLQVTAPEDTVYQFNVIPGDMYAFPLSSGNGHYSITMFEHAFDNQYAAVGMFEIDAELTNEFLPFLYPNEYAWFTEDSAAAALAAELSEQSTGDLDFVSHVYDHVISNIEYDTDLAAHIPNDYIPDADRTLANGTGICFDYASVMTSMLRAQGIPTKLVVGYADQIYHAWISVYLDEMGWVDNIIEFNGTDWSLMDPTFAANNDIAAVGEYIGGGDHYTAKYNY